MFLSKTLLSNPYVVGAAILLLVVSYAVVGAKAYKAGENACIAKHAELLDIELRTRDAALAAAGEAIQKIEVRNTTVRQKTETVTREVPVYRDCKHSADGLRLVNEALADGPQPVADGKLPAADAAGR